MSTIIELPLVVVCGATGSQGSSIAQYLLRDGGYKVRIITRNPNGEKAQALKQQGAEVFHCDIENKERVTLAFDGAYAVFGLTNFWEHGAEAEIRQGKNLADAARTCGVKHFLWSSCPHVDGEAPRHWDSKVEVEQYLHELGVPTTAIFPAFYFQNLWMFFPLKKLPDGSPVLDWVFPSEVPIPSFSVEDLGAWFMIALKDPGTWIGKQMKLTSEILTPRDYAVRLSNGMGMKVALKEVSLAEFEALRPHVPSDVWINIKAFWDNPDLMKEAVGSSRQLFPGWQSLENFAKKYKDKLLATAVPA